MKEAIVIYPAHGQGYAYAISFPKELVESFRALFSQSDDRDWQEPVWCFKRKNLPTVQSWAAQCVAEKQLALHDVTGATKSKREQILAEIWSREYEEHVAAMIEVLPKLPPGALRLTYWFSTHLVFDLGTFLGKPTFDELKQAALPTGKVPKDKKYISIQGSHDVRFYVAPDPRVLKALMPLRIRNLQVQHLTVVQLFENGTGHFSDQDGTLWFGALYQQLVESPCDLYETPRPTLPYTLAEIEASMYLVAPADVYLEHYCLGVASPSVSGMNPPPSTEALVSRMEHFSLGAWLSVHATHLINVPEEALTPHPNSTHMQLWHSPGCWKHPADFLLHYLELTDRTHLLALLDWDEERFQQILAGVQHMKVQKAEHYYVYCQEHAIELMQAQLPRLQRGEIQELAARYGITIPLWPKEKMIRQRCTDERMAEDFLGITEERQRRSTGEIDFADGIIWGKRDSSALYTLLRSGYLSDGIRVLSGLESNTRGAGWPHWSSSYALWEDWTSRKEKDRGQSLYSLLEKEGIEDLASWRWFAFRANEEHPQE